jgi:hypothetical protein
MAVEAAPDFSGPRSPAAALDPGPLAAGSRSWDIA